jgi:anti-sigma-K factor RskA
VTGCDSHADLIGGYVLGALDPAEEAAMRRHIEECDQCRREYESLAGIPALLDRIEPADVPPPAPAASLEDAVLNRVARERRERAARPRLSWPPRRALAGAVAAVAAAVVVALLVRAWSDDSSAYAWGKLSGVGGAGGRFTVQKVPAGTRVNLNVNGLKAAGAGYQVWCVRKDGRWVSGGSFRPRSNGQANVELTAAVTPGEYHVVVLTRRGTGKRGAEVMRGKLRY